MFRFLFPRLTDRSSKGAALFDRLVQEARAPHWYVEGQVPDTIDGRFAMLATLTALASVRIERGDPALGQVSAELVERFVAAMDSEHREMGVGDPTLGRKVRKLVGALSRRIDLWRLAVEGAKGWEEATAESLYRGAMPAGAAHASAGLRKFWDRLEAAADAALGQGRME